MRLPPPAHIAPALFNICLFPPSSVGFSCPLSYMKRDQFFNKRKLYLLHILDGNFGRMSDNVGVRNVK